MPIPQHRPFVLEMPVLDRQAFNAVHALLQHLLIKFENCYLFDPSMLRDRPDPHPQSPRAPAKRGAGIKSSK